MEQKARIGVYIGEVYIHYSSQQKYQVIGYSNLEGNKEKYPTTIIYQNINNKKIYSRPLSDWDRSMTIDNTADQGLNFEIALQAMRQGAVCAITSLSNEGRYVVVDKDFIKLSNNEHSERVIANITCTSLINLKWVIDWELTFSRGSIF